MMTYQMISGSVSADTVEACEQVAQAARDGHIVGAGFLLILKRRRFMVDVVGEAARDPTTTRGILAALDDELRDRVRAMFDTSTR